MEPPPEDIPEPEDWLITYADAITLLMAFMVMLLTFSEYDVPAFEEAAAAIQSNLTGRDTTSPIQLLRIDVQDVVYNMQADQVVKVETDDKGIVGQVVQTGETRRVDADIDNEQREIDRDVDQQLGFETQSLLCVPLRGKKDELFGAFEMINKIDGNFTDDDEAALIEMAGHASIALENTQQHEQLISSRNQMAEQAAEQAYNDVMGNH